MQEVGGGVGRNEGGAARKGPDKRRSDKSYSEMSEESFERVSERGFDTAAETDSESVLRLNLITDPSSVSSRSIVLWRLSALVP